MTRIARTLAFAFAAGTVNIPSAVVQAEKRVVVPPAISIEERSRSDGPTYYLLHITLPRDITAIRHAWLELRVDASATRIDGFADPAPLFEAYVLRQALSGDPSFEMFEPTRYPLSRPLAVGTDRIAKIDMTEFAQMVIAAPTRNHGIVFGAVTNATRGVFRVSETTGDITLVLIE